MNLAWPGVLAGLSGAALAIPFVFPAFYLVAWFAFVPFLVAIHAADMRQSYGLGLLFGMVFSVSVGHWMVDFLVLAKAYGPLLSKFWAALFWLYSAQLFALMAVVYQGLRRRCGLSELIVFPLVVVVTISAFPMLFPVRLGDSQSAFLTALQPIALTGVHGLDAVMALTNVLLFRLLVLRLLMPRALIKVGHPLPIWRGEGVAIAIVLAWLAWGAVSLSEWEGEVATWPSARVGMVQPNEAPQLGLPPIMPGYSRAYLPEMAMTERLAAAGAELVIWPEARYKGVLDQPSLRAAYAATLARLNTVPGMNTALLLQDIEGSRLPGAAAVGPQYNAAVMLSTGGEMSEVYRKQRRIAFGEYVPWVGNVPWLRQPVEQFLGEFLSDMTAGTAFVSFPVGRLQVIPLICYETLFPAFAADAVSAVPASASNGRLLVGLSSDGWFGESIQPSLHVNASVLRAVENRVPMVHVLNNGPSVVAMPTGRVIFRTPAHQAGGFLAEVPYANKPVGSVYSRYPHAFLAAAYGALGACLVMAMRRRQRAAPKKHCATG